MNTVVANRQLLNNMCIDGLYIAMEHSYCSIIPEEKGLKYFDTTMVHLVSSTLPCFICDGCHYSNYHQLQIILLVIIQITIAIAIAIIIVHIGSSRKLIQPYHHKLLTYCIFGHVTTNIVKDGRRVLSHRRRHGHCTQP